MAKTQEELNAIKEEVETLNKKLNELSGEEMAQVIGGIYPTWIPVDESCPEFNSGTTCPMSIMKGKYDNCHDCKHNQ